MDLIGKDRSTQTPKQPVEKRFTLQQKQDLGIERIGSKRQLREETANYQPMPSSEADGLLDDSMQTHEHGLSAVVAGDHYLCVPRQHGHLIFAPACRHLAHRRNHLATGSASPLPRILPNCHPIPLFSHGEMASESPKLAAGSGQSCECTSGALEIEHRGGQIRAN